MSSQSETIRSVQITCDLLDKLQELDGAGVTELADEMNHSKSTIHSHLATLLEHRLVVKEGAQYRLSLRFLDIAQHVRDQIGTYDVIRDELESLTDATGEVAQFGIEEHGVVSYLYKATGSRGVETASSVGTSQPMHSTALGKSILAHVPEERVDEIVDHHGLPARTRNTITDRDDLFDELETVRAQGYAIDDEENVEGLRCVAAPVLEDGSPFGAVSISGPASRFDGKVLREELPTSVTRAANVIELNSKFS